MAEFTDTLSIPGDWGGGFFSPETTSADDGQRFLPQAGSLMDLAVIREFFAPKDGDNYGFEELFFPKCIFVREEMETAFKELLHNGNNTLSVFSGSPGIGKSLVMFLVILYRATVKHEKTLYVRRTDLGHELVSCIVFDYNKEENNVRVRFTRIVDREQPLTTVYRHMRSSFEGVHYLHPSIVAAVDGPKSPEFNNFSRLNYGCTSGGGIKIFDHTVGYTFNIVMGGWKREDLETVVALLDQDFTDEEGQQTRAFDSEKFDATYFVRGGRIRRFYEAYLSINIDTSFEDEVVARISRAQASLTLSHSDCRSTDDHVDSLRTIFRLPTGTTDSVSMHVDSGYILRKLRAKVTGEELFNSFKQAQREGNKGAEANYFEELLHYCFCIQGLSPSITESIHSQGTGVQGVTELTMRNQYWMPSVPNFVNIDAALVGSDDKVWCYQYTVSSTHTYKKRRTKPQFLNHITFLSSTDEVILVFVVPNETNFTTPDTGGEIATEVFFIDCDTLGTVEESVSNLAARVAAPTAVDA